MGFHLFDCFQPPTYPRKRHYKLGRIIGQGTYGVVREAVAKNSQLHYAVKIISKALLPNHVPHFLQREISSLRSLHHPNIIRFIEHFESRKHHYLVCEMANGGELFNRILSQGRFTENDAAELVYQMVHAIGEAHRCGIVHRDLKPENVLFRSKEKKSDLVIADFGVSRMVSEDEVLFTVCGSPGYCAPEILLSKGHGKACDMWSIGVITYTVLCGYSPFGPIDNPRNLMKRMMSGTVEFHERYWQHISDDAKDFVRQLLQLNPNDRMTAEKALKHPWLQRVSHVDPIDASWMNLISEEVRNQLSTRRRPIDYPNYHATSTATNPQQGEPPIALDRKIFGDAYVDHFRCSKS